MAKHKPPEGMQWCKQCKQDMPEAQFLKPRRRGWKVTICDPCARSNMARWGKTHNVGIMPEDIEAVD